MVSSTGAAATVVSAASKAHNFANQTVENGRFEAIKEPIGFIKIVQILMAILCFAIAVNGSSNLAFTQVCKNTTLNQQPYITYQASYSYPYDLTQAKIVAINSCSSGSAKKLDRETLTTEGFNIKSSAEFFVFLGVVAFLYSLGMVIVYIFLKHKYDNSVFLPLIDFGVTVVFAICWFASDIAWAKAISDIQFHTNTDNVVRSMETACNPKSSVKECQSYKYASYGSIIISCIIGFCNLILWSGNIWFVLKETTWYKTRKAMQQQQQNITNNPISSNSTNNMAQAHFTNINDKI